MQSSIKIEHFWQIQSELIIGLNIQSNERFPIVVGCSLKTNKGEIVDIPARYLLSPGLSFWGTINVDSRFIYPDPAMYSDWRNKMVAQFRPDGWFGEIIFAMYTNATFGNRLADTGWVRWYSEKLKTNPDNRNKELDREIRDLYIDRNNKIWRPI